METIFNVCQIAENIRVRLASLQFRGKAYRWWNAVSSSGITWWDDLVQELRTQFSTSKQENNRRRRNYEIRSARLRMTDDEILMDYMGRFMSEIHAERPTEITDEELMSLFLSAIPVARLERYGYAPMNRGIGVFYDYYCVKGLEELDDDDDDWPVSSEHEEGEGSWFDPPTQQNATPNEGPEGNNLAEGDNPGGDNPDGSPRYSPTSPNPDDSPRYSPTSPVPDTEGNNEGSPRYTPSTPLSPIRGIIYNDRGSPEYYILSPMVEEGSTPQYTTMMSSYEPISGNAGTDYSQYASGSRTNELMKSIDEELARIHQEQQEIDRELEEILRAKLARKKKEEEEKEEDKDDNDDADRKEIIYVG